jgi:hypothetical protein
MRMPKLAICCPHDRPSVQRVHSLEHAARVVSSVGAGTCCPGHLPNLAQSRSQVASGPARTLLPSASVALSESAWVSVPITLVSDHVRI